MNLTEVRYAVEIGLLLLGFLGNLFLWFEADWFTGSSDFFGLFVSTFLTVVTGAGKMPAKFKTVSRTAAIFFLLNFQESAICDARAVFKESFPSQTDDQVRLARCGVFFALFTTYIIFAERILVPDTSRPLSSIVALKNFTSIRSAMFLAAACALFLCQGISWGVQDVCVSPPPNATPLNATPLTFSLLLLLGIVTDDVELLDLGIFVVLFAGFSLFRPIFNGPYQGYVYSQSNYEQLWRAQMAFGFIAWLLVFLGQLQHSARVVGGNVTASFIERLRQPTTLTLFALCLLGLSGSACVWSGVPPQGQYGTFPEASLAWFSTFAGLVVPILCFAAAVTGVRALAIVSVFITFNTSSFLIAQIDGYTPITGYPRGGGILNLIVLFASPVVALGDGIHIASDPGVYFEGPNRTPMMLCLLQLAASLLFWATIDMTYHALFLLTLLCAALFFLAACAGDVNLYKTVSYVFLSEITAGALWPLDRDAFTTDPSTILFLLVAWASVFYVNAILPGACFSCFHERDVVSGIELDAGRPFVLSVDGASMGQPHTGCYVAPDLDSDKKFTPEPAPSVATPVAKPPKTDDSD